MAGFLQTLKDMICPEQPVKEHNPTKLIQVREINKRQLGFEEVKLCGNTEAEDTPETAAIRRLIQGCITLVGDKPEEDWANADLRIFTNEGQEYCFQSGTCKNKFVAMYDENDKLYIKKKK